MLRLVPTHCSKVSNRRLRILQLILTFAFAASCYILFYLIDTALPYRSMRLTANAISKKFSQFDKSEGGCSGGAWASADCFSAWEVSQQRYIRRRSFYSFNIEFKQIVEVILLCGAICMRNAGAGVGTSAGASVGVGVGVSVRALRPVRVKV